MQLVYYSASFAGCVVLQPTRQARCDMIPPDHPRPLSSSSRPELREQSSCTSPALQEPTECSCCCRQDAKILYDQLRRLVPIRTGVTAAHRRRRRGTVSTHTRRHSVAEPALPAGQVFCDVIQMTLSDFKVVVSNAG